MRVNVGCGRDIRDGWVNIDKWPAPGVIQADLDDGNGLPFASESVDEVLARHVLEHVFYFDQAWREIHRVLRVGGILDVEVPYGPDFNPLHIRHFTEASLHFLVGENEEELGPERIRLGGHSGLQVDPGWYEQVYLTYLPKGGFPWWHLWHYLDLVWKPKAVAMQFRLRKVR